MNVCPDPTRMFMCGAQPGGFRVTSRARDRADRPLHKLRFWTQGVTVRLLQNFLVIPPPIINTLSEVVGQQMETIFIVN